MTTYRVGEAGATVFDADGRELSKLAPGQVVVAGTTDVRGSLAQQYEHTAQRRTGYDDKVIRPERGPTASRATPPRQPDPRLRNPLAGSG